MKNFHIDMAYKIAYNEISKGRQVYVVCPLIEEDEKVQLNSVESVYKKLKEEIFKDVSVNTITSYINYLQDSFLIEKATRYDV